MAGPERRERRHVVPAAERRRLPMPDADLVYFLNWHGRV
jgi:hypothetical protein